MSVNISGDKIKSSVSGCSSRASVFFCLHST
nr:MAG TPA: hypothetical protein [Siphoviridae sp. ct4aE30]